MLVAVLLPALGSIASLAALGVESGAVHGGSWCTAAGTFDCQAVLADRHRVRWPMPVSAAALGYFVVRLALALGCCRGPRPSHRLGLLLSLCAAAVAAGLLVAMVAVIGRLCWLCLSIDACVAAQCLVDRRLLRASHPAEPDRRAPLLIAGAVVGVGMLLFGGAAALVADAVRSHRDRASAAALLSARPAAGVPAWREGLPIAVVCFIDYRCDACLAGLATLREAARSAPAPLALEFVNVPLDPDCNPQVPGAGHAGACRVAESAVAAREAGTLDDLQRRILAGEPPAELAAEARARARATLAGDLARAATAGITTLPTYLVQGRRIEGTRSAEFFAALFDGIVAGRIPP
jgi:uncharacterized membrane protein